MLEPNKPNFDSSSLSPSQRQQPSSSVPQFSPSQFNAPGGGATYNSPGFNPSNGVGGVIQPQGQVPAQDERFYKGVHPFVALFHVLFKAGAILTFILGNVFSSNYVTAFVITILFLAADFWTTKNVSGRLLVCLRWWNEVREDGSTHWIFESAPDADARVNSFDKWFFWITTGGNFVVWVLMAIFNLMSFSRLPMAIIGAVLGGANFMGFLKCSRDAKKRVTEYMLARAAQQPNLVRQAANAL